MPSKRLAVVSPKGSVCRWKSFEEFKEVQKPVNLLSKRDIAAYRSCPPGGSFLQGRDAKSSSGDSTGELQGVARAAGSKRRSPRGWQAFLGKEREDGS